MLEYTDQTIEIKGNVLGKSGRKVRISKHKYDAMRIRSIFEGNEEPFLIPIGQLLLSKEEIAAAVSNLSRGLPSMTEGPLFVDYHPSLGRYQLTNGYHRLVEALMRGETEVLVLNRSDAAWSPPSGDNLFVPDWDSDYYGMEDFIELYELKRI